MRTESSTAGLCPATREFGPVKPFLEHLEDLRWVLLRCLVALALGMALCLSVSNHVVGLLMGPLDAVRAELATDASLVDQIPRMEQRGPSTPFSVAMKAGLYGGIGMSLPFMAVILGAYLAPAMKADERRYLKRALVPGLGLFGLGAAVAYFVVAPMILKSSIRFSAWLGLSSTVWFIEDYAGFVLCLVVGLATVFEMPLVVCLVVRIGLAEVADLRRWRPFAAVGILTVAAMLTPPDLGSCLLLAAPLLVLYELSLLLAAFSGGPVRTVR
jgi:sec-independent protein translocase protein TatC